MLLPDCDGVMSGLVEIPVAQPRHGLRSAWGVPGTFGLGRAAGSSPLTVGVKGRTVQELLSRRRTRAAAAEGGPGEASWVPCEMPWGVTPAVVGEVASAVGLRSCAATSQPRGSPSDPH